MVDDDSLLDALSFDEELEEIVAHLKGIRKDIRDGLKVTGVNIQRAVFEEEKTESYQFELSRNVPINETVNSEIEVPFDGRVDGFMVGFPDGSQQLVGLKLYDVDTGEKYFPRDNDSEYFASNDFFNEFKTRFDVEKGDIIGVEFKNNDEQNDHFLNAMVTVVNEDGN